MLNLKNIERHAGNVTTFEYEVIHVGDSTTLKQNLKIEAHDPNFYLEPKVVAKMEITECKGETVEEVLDKMAEWCERLAEGIRDRKRALSIFT
jgi:hypothetical protein